MVDMFTRGLLERKYANEEAQTQIQRQAATNLGLLQGAQANDLTTRTGLLPAAAQSENAFRDANTATVRAGLPFIAPRAQAEIGGIIANTGLTNRRAVTETFQPRLIMSTVGLNNANTRATNLMSADTGLERDDVLTGMGLSSFLGPRRSLVQPQFGAGIFR